MDLQRRDLLLARFDWLLAARVFGTNCSLLESFFLLVAAR